MRVVQFFGPFTGNIPDLVQDEDGVVWVRPLVAQDVSMFGGYYERLEDVRAEDYDSSGGTYEYPRRRPGATGSGPYTGGSWRPSRDAPNYNFNREPHPRVSGDEPLPPGVYGVNADWVREHLLNWPGHDDGIRGWNW